MDFSLNPMREAEVWHIWKQHHLIECFWKLLKSIIKIKVMQLRDHGLDTALLIKILAFLILIKFKRTKAFSHSTMTQIMRKLRQNLDLKDWINEHFHSNFSATYDDYDLSGDFRQRIYQPCWSFCRSSALSLRLHSKLCALHDALKTYKNLAQFW